MQAQKLVAAVPLQGQQIAAMFLISSLLAITHNLVNYKLVQHTSAVSATVIGEVKTITLIVLSAFLLGMGPLSFALSNVLRSSQS